MVEALLRARADADVQNSNGNTPLHLAAGKGWLDVAERLAGGGADLHIRNAKGWLAIQVCGVGGGQGRAWPRAVEWNRGRGARQGMPASFASPALTLLRPLPTPLCPPCCAVCRLCRLF